MKHIFSFVFLLLCGSCLQVQAQHVIYLSNGSSIDGQVLEVSSDEVSYRRADNADGPMYRMEKCEVDSIVYGNGTKDVFADAGASEAVKKLLKLKDRVYVEGNLTLGMIEEFVYGAQVSVGYEFNRFVSAGLGAMVLEDTYQEAHVSVYALARGNFSRQPAHGFGELKMGADFYEGCFLLMPTVGYMFAPFGERQNQLSVSLSSFNTEMDSGVLFSCAYRFGF